MGALQHCCSYKRCLPELSVQGDVPVSGLVEEEQVGVDSWLLAILKLKQQRYLMTYFEEILSLFVRHAYPIIYTYPCTMHLLSVYKLL